jgi:hypothetical protein
MNPKVGDGGTKSIIYSYKFEVTAVINVYKTGPSAGVAKTIAVYVYCNDDDLCKHLAEHVDHQACGNCDILTRRRNGKYMKKGETAANSRTSYNFGERFADTNPH